MSRSFIHPRRALFGVSCAIVLGFGATEALANARREDPPPGCIPFVYEQHLMCDSWCREQTGVGGFCSRQTQACMCFTAT